MGQTAGNNKIRPAGHKPTGRKRNNCEVELHSIIHTAGAFPPGRGRAFFDGENPVIFCRYAFRFMAAPS